MTRLVQRLSLLEALSRHILLNHNVAPLQVQALPHVTQIFVRPFSTPKRLPRNLGHIYSRNQVPMVLLGQSKIQMVKRLHERFQLKPKHLWQMRGKHRVKLQLRHLHYLVSGGSLFPCLEIRDSLLCCPNGFPVLPFSFRHCSRLVRIAAWVEHRRVDGAAGPSQHNPFYSCLQG